MVGQHLSPKLYSVTVVASIALHAALAFLIKVPQPPEPQPPKTVKITDLVAPKTSTVPTVTPKSKPKTASRQPSSIARSQNEAETPRRVVQKSSIAEISQSIVQAPRSVPVASQPVNHAAQDRPTSTQPPTSTASSAPAPTSTKPAVSGTVSDLFAQLGSSSPATNNSSPAPALFADPSKFFEQGATSTPTLKPEILRATSIADKAPGAVYIDILVTQGQSANFQVSERGNYGGGTVYQVTQGKHSWYFNLLPTKDATGTLIVVWQNDPSISVQ